MFFNSFEYLIFLPIVFGLYWFVFKSLKVQNLFVVLSSYIFYGWWDYRFLFLIALTTLLSYISGIGIKKCTGGGKINVAKLLAASNIIVNLIILGIFKYYNFFVDSLAYLLSFCGIQANITSLQLILPVGISFYTFQALSYTIDVYRKKIEATHDITAFFAYISFFPQLVAGPIERATNLLPQFYVKRHFDYNVAVDGMKQILWGLFKKMVIADNCADLVDKVWGDYSTYNSLTLIIVSVLFAFQIYGDFSGYSDIAIGTAKLFGIRLRMNFNLPYFSRNVAEFWKRWHISLNTWFVDYVYIPLGGSRNGKYKTIRNTFVIFLLSGLWHGANWTYVTWGAYHAMLFVPLLAFNGRRRFDDVVANDRILPNMRDLLQMAFTFLLVVFGWIIFRADNMSVFADFIHHIFLNIKSGEIEIGSKTWLFIVFMVIIEWINRRESHAFARLFTNKPLRWGCYLLIALLCLTKSGHQVQFIYFQF